MLRSAPTAPQDQQTQDEQPHETSDEEGDHLKIPKYRDERIADPLIAAAR